MTKEAIKLALQYIEANAETKDEHEIAEGLRQAIAEAEKQNEPVAWGMEKDGLILDVICPDEHGREEGGYTIALYTHPKEWVGLTDDEVSKIIDKVIGFNSCAGWEEEFARAIEAKLKEKNN
jgi:hypothetical protein